MMDQNLASTILGNALTIASTLLVFRFVIRPFLRDGLRFRMAQLRHKILMAIYSGKLPAEHSYVKDMLESASVFHKRGYHIGLLALLITWYRADKDKIKAPPPTTEGLSAEETKLIKSFHQEMTGCLLLHIIFTSPIAWALMPAVVYFGIRALFREEARATVDSLANRLASA